MRSLFGDRLTSLHLRWRSVVMDRFADPLAFREYWKRNYGPVIAVYRFNEDQPERVVELDRGFEQFLTTWNRSTEPGRTAYEAEYLLLTGVKR